MQQTGNQHAPVGWDIPALLFSFTGRIDRGKYWACTVGATAVGFVAILLSYAIHDTLGVVVWLLAFPVSLWVSFALLVKRLQDLPTSGWWCLLALVPLLGQVFVIAVALISRETATEAPTQQEGC